MKYCSRGHAKSPANMYQGGNCKICQRLRAERHYDKDRDSYLSRAKLQRSVVDRAKLREYNRSKMYKREYGLTIDMWEEQSKRQNNRCAICGMESKGKRLAVDHEHGEPRRLRGLLCPHTGQCNWALGVIEKNAKRSGLSPQEWVKSALDYLSNPVWISPIYAPKHIVKKRRRRK